MLDTKLRPPEAKPILVVGASGLVGGGLLTELHEHGYTAIGTHRSNRTAKTVTLDMSRHRETKRFLKEVAPAAVFVSAAIANVAVCEAEPERTWKANVEDMMAFSEMCGPVPLIYFSSEYVFDGLRGPYTESAATNPLSEYGRQKVAVENYLVHRSQTLIIRTMHVFGKELHGKNFVCRLITALREDRPFFASTDQFSRPTYNPQLARAAVTLMSEGINGVVHLAGVDTMSRYSFARLVARVFGLKEELVIGMRTSELGLRAPCPLNAPLISERVDCQALGFTHVTDALHLARREML